MQTLLLALHNFAADNVSLNSLPHVNTGSSSNVVHTILSIVIGVIAALSFLMVVIGGFRYVLSEGDPQSISKAKSTIVYALVGLVIAILAQAIVSFVLVRVK